MSDALKIVVGFPAYDQVHPYFATSLALMVANCNVPAMLSTSCGANVCENRNSLVRKAIAERAEYLLTIDSDLSFPIDAANRLVRVADERGLDVVGCNYLAKRQPHHLLIQPLEREVTLTGIDEVKRLPTGFLLVRVSVFERLDPPWFAMPPSSKGGILTEDYWFCDRAREAGVRLYMDTALSLSLVHWSGLVGVQWTGDSGAAHYQYRFEL